MKDTSSNKKLPTCRILSSHTISHSGIRKDLNLFRRSKLFLLFSTSSFCRCDVRNQSLVIQETPLEDAWSLSGFLSLMEKTSAVFRGYLTLIGCKIRFEKKNNLSVANLWKECLLTCRFVPIDSCCSRLRNLTMMRPMISCLPPTLIEGETFMTMLERKQRLILRGMNIYIYMLNGFTMPLEDALLSCGEQ